MSERTRCLIFDPFSGVSGDMILGGLLDVGLPLEWLEQLASSLPLRATLRAARVKRGSIEAWAVRVEASEATESRRLEDVLAIVDGAAIDARARSYAVDAFRRLAEVEGALHGLPPEQVHFHEVGAADALIDVIGAAAAVAQLGIDSCYTRPVAVGRGWVDAAHGQLPLPAPATLRLLEGLPVYESELEGELTTPTGAVLLSVLTGGRRLPGPYTPIRSGFGAGSRDPTTHPNCLRLTLAELDPRGPMTLLQADVDDMSPEYLPPLLGALQAAGAVDVWSFPLQMKKGRSGQRIEALVPEERREEVSRALFSASTTLGLRFWQVERQVLPRSTNTIEWRGLQIRIKTSRTPEGHVRCKPEYDDVIEAARKLGISALEARLAIERLLERQSGVS